MFALATEGGASLSLEVNEWLLYSFVYGKVDRLALWGSERTNIVTIRQYDS